MSAITPDGIAAHGAAPTGIPVARPIFLYDGDCGPCDSMIDGMRRRIAPPVDFVPFQSVDFRALGVTEAEVLSSPVLVCGDGSHLVGPAAMSGMMLTARNPYRTMGRVMAAPGVRHLLGVLQPIMYRNRYRLPGGTDACRIPASTTQADVTWIVGRKPNSSSA